MIVGLSVCVDGCMDGWRHAHWSNTNVSWAASVLGMAFNPLHFGVRPNISFSALQ